MKKEFVIDTQMIQVMNICFLITKLKKKEIYSNCNGEECPCPDDIYGNLIETIEY